MTAPDVASFPFLAKNEIMTERAENRVKRLEAQLKDNPYGIAYADSTEKIVQLNRSIENNLLNQIEKLQDSLYSQLGITDEVMKFIVVRTEE